jgi:uncharacterized membrane protein YdjX (TVP38/TMEM64 family)
MKRDRSILLAAVLLSAAIFFWLDLGRFLSLSSLKEHRHTLQNYYSLHAFRMMAAFFLLYVIQTALSLPGAAVMSLAAGAIFGTMTGTFLAVISAAIGATAAFLVTRYIAGDAVTRIFGARLEKLDRELDERGFNYLLFLRLVPLFPFFLINLAAGMTRISLRTFFTATLIGIIPGAFVYVNAGASLAEIDSLSSIATPRILGSFILLAIFSLIPAVYNRIRRDKSA